MITKEKLKIYALYNGDIDAWVRCGNQEQKTIITNDDWSIIDNLLQDFELAINKLLYELEKEVYRQIQSKLVDVEAFKIFETIASTRK